jgi:hypothetical protein
MLKIDLGEISNNTPGLPDCWHIDSKGISSQEVYHKHFHLPRSVRKDKKALESLQKRSFRLIRMAFSLLLYRKLTKPILLTGDERTSPECYAMARYDEGWHLRDEYQLIHTNILQPEDQQRRIAGLVDSFNKKNWQNWIQILAARSNCTPDRVIEGAAKCALETWLRARNDLINWAELDPERQSLLAEVIFAGFTLFGKDALEEAAAIQPQVLDHYHSFLDLRASPQMMQRAPIRQPDICTEEQQLPPQTDLAAQDANIKPLVEEPVDLDLESVVQVPASFAATAQPQSLQELYEIIGRICSAAQLAKSCEPHPAREIQTLIEQHLERLAELEARMSPDEIEALIERYCQVVLRMMAVLDFEHSEQRDLVPVLRAAWRSTVISALEAGLPQVWFISMLEERRDMPEMVKRFTEESQKVSAAYAEAQTFATQLLTAKYTAKAGLKSKETRVHNAMREAQQELDNIRVEVAESLVPDGKKLDDLVDNHLPGILAQANYDTFNPGALKSLKTIFDSICADGATLDAAPVSSSTALPEGLVQAESFISVSAHIDKLPQAPVEPLVVLAATTTITFTEEVVETSPRQPLESTESLVEPATVVTSVSAPLQEPNNVLVHVDLALAAPAVPAVIAMPKEPVSDFVVDEYLETAVAVSESSGVDDAIKHLRYTESVEEVVQAFRIAAEQFHQVPEALAEAIAMHWLKAGHLNVAHQVLRDANDSVLLGGRVLDPSLLRSAFYGMNVWPKDREALGYMQRDLNLINYQDLDEQLDRKPTGKLVPYLLAVATLQPALFAGKETQAPGLLKIASGYFDGPLKQLLTSTADFSTRSGRVDWDALRDRED